MPSSNRESQNGTHVETPMRTREWRVWWYRKLIQWWQNYAADTNEDMCAWIAATMAVLWAHMSEEDRQLILDEPPTFGPQLFTMSASQNDPFTIDDSLFATGA